MHPASEFLEALGKQRSTFQTFPDSEAADSRPQILHGPHSVLDRRLRALNQDGAGIFVMVNHGDLQGRRAENVKQVAAYFVDLDGSPLPDEWPLTPTAVVESSPGRYHAYWRVDGAPREQFELVQKHIAVLFAGDEKVCDLPRVMRLPGYEHRKREPFTSRILELNQVSHDHSTFTDAFGVPAPPRPLPQACVDYIRSRQKSKTRFRDESSPGIDRALEHITKAGEGNRNHTLFRMAAAVANDVKKGSIDRAEAEKQLLDAAIQSGLGEHEATRTIHSAMRYAK
jgi:hypothetical protein